MLSALKNRLIGAEPTVRMPERVAAKIREERERGEILIGWVQFAGVLMFPSPTRSRPRRSTRKNPSRRFHRRSASISRSRRTDCTSRSRDGYPVG